MSGDIYEVAKSITSKMGELIGVRVYITIADQSGNFICTDSMFDNHKEFIQSFIQNNFQYLKLGEHSIPLSSENIIFFKTTDNTITILYNPKGKIGQLLAFKSIMKKYCDIIDSYIAGTVGAAVEAAQQIPQPVEITKQALKIPTLFSKKKLYGNIKPIVSKKLKKKDKFSVLESKILSMADGNTSLFNIIEATGSHMTDILNTLYNFLTKKLIFFEDHEFIKIPCPQCKNSAFLFIPKTILGKFDKRIRVQLFPEGCDHTFIAFIDSKMKIKTKKIDKLLDISESLDLSDLNMEKLISFFGQDLFFNIFHAIFFRFYTVFVGDSIAPIIQLITDYLKKFFTQIQYGYHIFSIDKAEFETDPEKYRDYLVVDLDSNITIDPYDEEELFDFEFNLFRNVLKSKGEQLRILETYQRFERLILLTDTVLKELESVEQISEDDLIKNMDSIYQMTIERSEIPIIKKLAEIYYETDIFEKVTRTVSGQISDWFDKW